MTFLLAKLRKMTLRDRMEWAASHGACDSECEGRCMVCPRDALEEGMKRIEELEDKVRQLQEREGT